MPSEGAVAHSGLVGFALVHLSHRSGAHGCVCGVGALFYAFLIQMSDK